MWKTQIRKAIKELRFNVKQGPEHHGTWFWINNKLPEVRVFNQNTFFSVAELPQELETKSACHVIYGDRLGTEDAIETAGLSPSQFEEILKTKIAKGIYLRRDLEPQNDDERDMPMNIVEAHKYVKYMDDTF